MFASFGALSLGDFPQVQATLNNFLTNLRNDGHVAMRIGTKNQILRYLKLPTSHGVFHVDDKGGNDTYDGNSLLLIIAEKYERLSGDRLDRNLLTEVVRWLDHHDRDGLLHEGMYASWEDSIKHTGPRLATNVCYYRALVAAAALLDNPIYLKRAEHTKNAIGQWWNGEFFTDGANAVCMTGGNLLAILWGMTTKEQSSAILKRIASRTSIIPPAGFWKPGSKDVFLLFFLINLSDYHGMLEWSWLAAAEIAAYRVIGNSDEADRREKLVMELIEKDATFYEVYENDKPVSRLVYRSEKDFAWALGMLTTSRANSFHIFS
jgi:hypothetical protein